MQQTGSQLAPRTAGGSCKAWHWQVEQNVDQRLTLDASHQTRSSCMDNIDVSFVPHEVSHVEPEPEWGSLIFVDADALMIYNFGVSRQPCW